MMKTICVLALGALVVGCHLDKLVSGSGGPHPTSTAPPVALVFMAQPRNAQVGQQITPVQVSVVDSARIPVTGAETTTVVVTLGANPGGAKLQGDTSAHPTRGVATFSNLSIDKADTGYTLIARAAGLPDTTSARFNITAPPPTTGDLTVTTSTSGTDIDSDGYTVTLDGSTGQSIGSNDATGVRFPNLSAGSHSVALSGVASNCTVSGGTSHGVTIVAGQPNSTAFSVTCTPIPPTTGSLTVTTNTSGADLDPDGYTLTVDAGGQGIGINSSATITGLAAGGHSVTLSAVASNCTVSGANPRTVSVTAGGTTSTTFTVSCTALPPTTGDLAVTTSTGGSDPDPHGYPGTLDGAPPTIGPRRSLPLHSL